MAIFSVSSQVAHQAALASRSYWSSKHSRRQLIGFNTFASSAYNNIDVCLTHSGKSLMNKRKSMRLKTFPCGMPLVQDFSVDDTELIDKNCSLSVRKDAIQLCRWPWMPYARNLSKNFLWMIVSKALLRLAHTPSTHFSWLMLSLMRAWAFISCVRVKSPDLKTRLTTGKQIFRL